MHEIDIRNLTAKWFSESTPTNYKESSATFGEGTNGVITVNAIDDITDDKSIEVVVGSGASKPLSVAFANDTLTITLATNASSAADDTKNTAKLIAEAISKVDGFSATFSGTGATAISLAVTKKSFTAGQLGTPCSTSGVALMSNGTYYVCIEPNATNKNSNWRTFTLTDY